jgi:hypothetical protein
MVEIKHKLIRDDLLGKLLRHATGASPLGRFDEAEPLAHPHP